MLIHFFANSADSTTVAIASGKKVLIEKNVLRHLKSLAP